MAVDLDNWSDDELERGLASGELGDKKAAIAKEVLRRRREERAEELKRKYKYLGGILAALALAFASLRRLWRR
jgi:hypothetical protein